MILICSPPMTGTVQDLSCACCHLIYSLMKCLFKPFAIFSTGSFVIFGGFFFFFGILFCFVLFCQFESF